MYEAEERREEKREGNGKIQKGKWKNKVEKSTKIVEKVCKLCLKLAILH